MASTCPVDMPCQETCSAMCFCLTKQPNTFSARYVITAALASYPTHELIAMLTVPHGLLPGFSAPWLWRSDTLVALQPDISSASAAAAATIAIRLIRLY